MDRPEYRYPSELVIGVLDLLEEAGVPTEKNDKIVEIIEEWERQLDAGDDDD